MKALLPLLFILSACDGLPYEEPSPPAADSDDAKSDSRTEVPEPSFECRSLAAHSLEFAYVSASAIARQSDGLTLIAWATQIGWSKPRMEWMLQDAQGRALLSSSIALRDSDRQTNLGSPLSAIATEDGFVLAWKEDTITKDGYSEGEINVLALDLNGTVSSHDQRSDYSLHYTDVNPRLLATSDGLLLLYTDREAPSKIVARVWNLHTSKTLTLRDVASTELAVDESGFHQLRRTSTELFIRRFDPVGNYLGEIDIEEHAATPGRLRLLTLADGYLIADGTSLWTIDREGQATSDPALLQGSVTQFFAHEDRAAAVVAQGRTFYLYDYTPDSGVTEHLIAGGGPGFNLRVSESAVAQNSSGWTIVYALPHFGSDGADVMLRSICP